MKDQDTTRLPLRLCDATLADMPKTIKRPRYDRSALTPGIVHIGLGNFHRAHQAWYIHRLMQTGRAYDWGIIGAGVRAYDTEQRANLAKQDYLTTLIKLDPDGASAEIVGSMIGYVPVESDNRSLIRQMADPAIRIVSFTVTEGGYYLDPATKKFDRQHADIAHDIAHLEAPRTAFGATVAALGARRAAGLAPFTCQSCDNLPGNGHILRDVILGIAKLADADLADWIERAVSFPNSMVDCIVPATGPAERDLVRSLGIDDAVPVTHENFRQWVMEDNFCSGRPRWEDAGATMSDQVHAFEAMKLRILNGGHQLIAAPAEVLGLTTIAQAMDHKPIKALFQKVALTEIAPHVPAVPGMPAQEYVQLVDKRFSNPAIHDTVRRVAFDGASRHTGAVLPVIRDALASGSPIEGLTLCQALWARMCAGTREDGSSIEANDPLWDKLSKAARTAQENPVAWLEQRDIYGSLVGQSHFRDAFSKWLRRLHRDGVDVTLQAYL